VPLVKGTIPHTINARFGAGKVFMKPASEGTGVIAGGPVRIIMELAGVKDILTKSLGSANALNIVNATIAGLKELKEHKDLVNIRQKEIQEQSKGGSSEDK